MDTIEEAFARFCQALHPFLDPATVFNPPADGPLPAHLPDELRRFYLLADGMRLGEHPEVVHSATCDFVLYSCVAARQYEAGRSWEIDSQFELFEVEPDTRQDCFFFLGRENTGNALWLDTRVEPARVVLLIDPHLYQGEPGPFPSVADSLSHWFHALAECLEQGLVTLDEDGCLDYSLWSHRVRDVMKRVNPGSYAYWSDGSYW